MVSRTTAYQDIVDVMQGYFDVLYHADVTILSTVFHPDARYVNLAQDDYMNYSLEEYFEIVKKRTPPAHQGELRNDHILSIEVGHENLAFVKANMTMMGRDYLDFLTFAFDGKDWRIISKAFTYTIQKEAP